MIEQEDLLLHFQDQPMRARFLWVDKSKTEAPVLVFLHEGLGSIELWKDVPEEICRRTGLNGFIYERIGFGKSAPLTQVPRPMNYLDIEGGEVLAEVLAQANITRPLLIGHSDGGSIALQYAAHHPQMPVAVITEAAHVFVENITIKGILEAGELFFNGDKLKAALEKYHGENTEMAFRGWYDTWTTPEFFHWNMEDKLPAITAPVLAIQGINDEYGSDDQVHSIVKNTSGPAEAALIPDCAHVPHFQARQATLDRMVDFISSLKIA